ncbi:hypothetical protein BDN67DRAFT_1014980 [Paxillus ammoniavirescens]|nr:hypothetical protein BDN67DRAFT_1014980 [Paxillus ammoniavirescens]
MQALEVPLELPLRLTDIIADYMLDRLNDYLQSDPNVPPSIPSPYIPVDAVQQADRFAEILALTYKNPIVIDINTKHLQEGLNAHDYGMNEKWEVDLLRRFNVPEIPPIVTLAVLVDKAGVVLLWSLPEVLSSNFQDLMWEALHLINAMLACSIAKPKADSTWRTVHGNFEGAEIQGCLNFSRHGFSKAEMLPPLGRRYRPPSRPGTQIRAAGLGLSR